MTIAPQVPVVAACFKADPLVPPTKEMKSLVDYQQNGMVGFGESPYGRSQPGYPPTVTETTLKLNARRTMGIGESGKVSYFEPAPNGTWRVCRVDLWVPKRDSEDHRIMSERTLRYSAGNDFLGTLVQQDRNLAYSTVYSYDTKGRIDRIEKANFSERPKTTFKAKHCRRYDERDNVVLWVSPEHTNKCPSGDPSSQDEWRQFKYGQYNGEQVELLSRWHIPKEDGRWKEQWEPFQISPTPGSARGHANVDSQRGVWEIFGSNYGRLDNNAANMVVDEFGHWNGSNYYFPKPPVPMTVLEKPEEIYKLERRRVSRVDNQIRLVELFKPNEHVSRHRFYTLDGNVLRHEQLNQKGKITRIITINDWRQPRPGSKPDFDDRLLSTSTPRVAGLKIYHRVYDIMANGRASLVAVSWDASNRLPFQDAPVSVSNLAYGTPDGKIRWRSAEDFNRAFDTSDNASQVYPDKQNIDIGSD
ncbi:hypothetical protein [Duganella sp. CF458]|uniref:hypothetical protein n=1 Tax=Duganella sp. CF458 TaxID=1884368 RepID=UPI0011139667|nr:hypothetical protein [Duganella sp. CF458]